MNSKPTFTPTVSLILVVRNEIEYVKLSLSSYLIQNYPKNKIQIILVDGDSTDGTKEYLINKKIELLQMGYDTKFFDNPQKILSTGWNIGVKNSDGEIVCRIDAHSTIDNEYILRGVKTLVDFKEENVISVGGIIIENIGINVISDPIADLFSSKFGVGNSPFRTSDGIMKITDTAVFGLYWKWVFIKVGNFNESIKRNQDTDFHKRIHQLGYKIMTNPQMKIKYYVRNSLKKLIQKAYADGYWVIYSKRSLLRHRIPLFFVLYLLTSSLMVIIRLINPLIAFMPLNIYIILSIIFGVKDGSSKTSKVILPLYYSIFHISYGLGSLIAFIKQLSTKRWNVEITNQKHPIHLINRVNKRIFDITVSIIGLLITFPIIILAILIASIDTKSYGIYLQQRVGKNGNIFRIIKIKTMRKLKGNHTTVTTINDYRITKSGKFFRKIKIDELPQFVNVLLGHMSLVGPRPDVKGFYDELVGDERKILLLRPGITGPASIKYRNEEEILSRQKDPEIYNKKILFPDKVKINLEYLENYSFINDIRYIIRSIFHR